MQSFVLAAMIFGLCAAKSVDPNAASCSSVKSYFESINVTSSMTTSTSQNGPVCNGHCCDSSTETVLLQKSTSNFERVVRNHIKSHRSLWETTSNTFREHILELLGQSENRTLGVFAKVYSQTTHLSQQLVDALYKSIRSHFLSTLSGYDASLEQSIHNFFTRLFPVAYLHIISQEKTSHTQTSVQSDFHEDYKNCLRKSYDKFKPFGDTPDKLVKELSQSVRTAAMFLKGLTGGAEVLLAAESLDVNQVDTSCKEALLKMNYCSSCRGYGANEAKPCYAYCMNVMRGCLSLYMGPLNKDWNSFTEAIPKLKSIISAEENGIESIIKSLDKKFSDAIIHAIRNGEKTDDKVKRECGNPSLDSKPNTFANELTRSEKTASNKWPAPPYVQLLDFIATLGNNKDFFMRIGDSFCENDDVKHQNNGCWTGTHLGSYEQEIVKFEQQKYNPAVQIPGTPQLVADFQNSQLHSLSDKLIQLRYTVHKAIPSENPHRDESMQADMADEGSAYYEEGDDEDYANSGDGSGSHPFEPRTPMVSINSTPPEGPASASNSLQSVVAVLLASIVCVTVFRIRH